MEHKATDMIYVLLADTLALTHSIVLPEMYYIILIRVSAQDVSIHDPFEKASTRLPLIQRIAADDRKEVTRGSPDAVMANPGYTSPLAEMTRFLL